MNQEEKDSLEYEKSKFAVEVKKDKHFPDGLEFSCTHNGYQWHTIGFRTRDEARKAISALQDYLDDTL